MILPMHSSVVTGFDYIPEPVHQWQSLDMIFKQGGGDCEDLAHLEASLLTRALIDAGFEDVANSITLVAGAVGPQTAWLDIPFCNITMPV